MYSLEEAWKAQFVAIYMRIALFVGEGNHSLSLFTCLQLVFWRGKSNFIAIYVFTRKYPTSRDVEDRGNALFIAHWRASRDQRVQPFTSTVSATDRLKALRERVLSKTNCG